MNGLSILVYQSQKKILEFSARNQYSRCKNLRLIFIKIRLQGSTLIHILILNTWC